MIPQFIGDKTGKRLHVAPHGNEDPTPASVLMLYLATIIRLLVEKTNPLYQQYLHTVDNKPSPVPDITESEMSPSLVIIIQMEQNM
jgi:hypothetical protein